MAEPYNVPDTPHYLARWIWQNYVGIPAADEPPYDAEFTRLLKRIEALVLDYKESMPRHYYDYLCDGCKQRVSKAIVADFKR